MYGAMMFVLGGMLGGCVGVITMCMLQINRIDEEYEEIKKRMEDENEANR